MGPPTDGDGRCKQHTMASRREQLFGGGAAGGGLLPPAALTPSERLSAAQSTIMLLSFVCVAVLFALLAAPRLRHKPAAGTDGDGAAATRRRRRRSSGGTSGGDGDAGSDDEDTDAESAARAARAAAVPLVMLVNVKSGGGAGGPLMALLRSRVTHPPDVYPLSREGVGGAMRRLAQLRAAGGAPRLVTAGGDGTVTAVVRTLLERGLAGAVPVAVLPLGTGNDLGRTLATFPPGPDLTSPSAMGAWLDRVRRGRVLPADVCSVGFDTHDGGSIVCVRDRVETQLAERAVRGTCLMYLSLGLDARLVYTAELHRHRSRALNKVNYALAGAYNVLNALGRRPPVTATMTSLAVDGIPVRPADLPFGLQSLVCLLIPSYAGGAPLWGCAWPAWPDAYRRMYAAAAAAAGAPAGDATANAPPARVIPVPPALMQPAAVSIRALVGSTPAGKAVQRWWWGDEASAGSGFGGGDDAEGGSAVAGCVARYRRRLRRLMQRLLRTPDSPYPQQQGLLPTTSPSSSSSNTGSSGSAASIGGGNGGDGDNVSAVDGALRTLRYGVGLDLRRLTAGSGVEPRPTLEDGWPEQSLADGRFELVGVRSLLQLAGVVGPKTPLLGGVYRLGQPARVTMRFACPPRRGFTADGADLTPMVALETRPLYPQQHSSSGSADDADADLEGGDSTGGGSAPSAVRRRLAQADFDGSGVAGGPGSTLRRVPSLLQSPSAAAAALGQAVRRTARKLQTHRRRGKAAVLAPPETIDEGGDGDDGGDGTETDGGGSGVDGGGGDGVDYAGPLPPYSDISSANRLTASGPGRPLPPLLPAGFHGLSLSQPPGMISARSTGGHSTPSSPIAPGQPPLLYSHARGASAFAGSTSHHHHGGPRGYAVVPHGSIASSGDAGGGGEWTPGGSAAAAAPGSSFSATSTPCAVGPASPPRPAPATPSSAPHTPHGGPPSPLTSPGVAISRATAGIRQRAGGGGGGGAAPAAPLFDGPGAAAAPTEAAGAPVSATPSKSTKVAASVAAGDVTPRRGASAAGAARRPPALPPPPVRVPMGGVFADSDPVYIQVDGEGYKVYGLRSVEVAWAATALLVTFAD